MELEYIEYKYFDPKIIMNYKIIPPPKGNRGGNKRKYLECVCAFDIETTYLGEEIDNSIMYVWQFQIEYNKTIIGRTWEEFLDLLNNISNFLEENVYIVIYVHYLSFEFQFLKGIYNFKNENIFALGPRKIAKCTMYDHFEFRCSNILSNMKLSQFLYKNKSKYSKLDGDIFDYSKKRYPWTKLTKYELDYAITDVIGLVDAINIQLYRDEDNLYTIPITSTGYVRREVKTSMKEIKGRIRKTLPDIDIYYMLREAFRGGNTHANRYYVGDIIKNVTSADRTSSYPDVLCNKLFPISQFKRIGPRKYDEILNIINIRHRAVIMRCSFTNLRLSDKFYPCPYLSKDKSRHIKDGIFDNGRILSASYLETTLTEIDFKIVINQYDFDDCVTFDIAIARYGKLPKEMITPIIKFFEQKTKLKNIEGEELYYEKSKNLLNGIYGLTAQDPVRAELEFIDNVLMEKEDIDYILQLDKTYKTAFLPYQWGVWTTAHSRQELQYAIDQLGDNFIYCDTDSVYYINEYNWNTYNSEHIQASKESGAYAKDKYGNIHYMGTFLIENKYDKFSTLGAKKYCVELDNKLKITIAGVSKSKGGEELEKNGGIKNFKEGFTFISAGGTEARYNDEKIAKSIEIEGNTIIITSNVSILNSTYTLGISEEYKNLLKYIGKYLTEF